MIVGQRVWYHSAVNRKAVEAVVAAVNPDETVDVSFPDRPGVKLSVPVADDYPVVEIRGQSISRSYVSVAG